MLYTILTRCASVCIIEFVLLCLFSNNVDAIVLIITFPIAVCRVYVGDMPFITLYCVYFEVLKSCSYDVHSLDSLCCCSYDVHNIDSLCYCSYNVHTLDSLCCCSYDVHNLDSLLNCHSIALISFVVQIFPHE